MRLPLPVSSCDTQEGYSRDQPARAVPDDALGCVL